MNATLDALLSPRSVAIVGASDNVARIGGRPLRYMKEAGFRGAIYPVNPTRDSVQGFKSYSAIAALPEIPDVAILAVPADATIEAVESCAALGIRSAIIFSAGFAETGPAGAQVQDRMVAAARTSGMRLLGPNCLGVFNPARAFYGTFSVVLDNAFIAPGPVGIVSQSGAYGAHIAHLARQRGLGISQWVTTGNECDIDLAEALDWMVDQPETRVIMAYAEGIRRRDHFIASLEKARRAEKAVVFLKTGRSSVGAEAVSSHTAALAGSDDIFSAVLRQYGAHRAETTVEQLDVAQACAAGHYPRGRRFGIFTMSGGFGIQLADDADAAGLNVAPMPESAQAELKRLLPYASPRNPVDATAQAVTDLSILTQCVRTMFTQGDYDIFAAILGTGPATKTFAEPLREAFIEATRGFDTTVKALTMSVPPEIVRRYEQDGFLVYEDGSALAHVLGVLANFRDSFDRARAAEFVPAATRIELPTETLSEHGAKRVLTQAGLTFPKEILVLPGEDAGIAADAIGYPVVVKISSPDIAHKTEIGGVRLNITSADQARAAAAAILQGAREQASSARIEGVTVSRQIAGGTEVIVGVTRDPIMGPVVMVGLGGIFVEVLHDVAFRAAPFGVEEARRMIEETKAIAVLRGVRGAPPADIDALARLVSEVSRFAAAHADRLVSLEMNPVRVMPAGEGVIPLDALLILEKV